MSHVIFGIFGPPATGKSTTLGAIASAAGFGLLPTKCPVVDMEAFHPDGYPAGLEALLGRPAGFSACGGAAVPLEHFMRLPGAAPLLLLPPDLDAYLEIYDRKALHRGVGAGTPHHDRAGAIRVYEGYSRLSRNQPSIPRLSDTIEVLAHICGQMTADPAVIARLWRHRALFANPLLQKEITPR